LDRKYAGFAGTISGDARPFSGTPGPLGKDDLGYKFMAGVESAGQIANGVGIVTNFGAPINVPGVGLVNPLSGPFSAAWNARDSTQSLPNSGIWNTMNTNILGQGSALNKQLSITYANIFWSPVAFIDFGFEYAWGHRITLANFKGDAYTLQGEMRVRF